MSLAFAPTLYTVEEYLAFERAAAERHEYLDGHTYKMAGESGEHADICANLSGFLHPQLIRALRPLEPVFAGLSAGGTEHA
jgi:Uma2 family endonuclease